MSGAPRAAGIENACLWNDKTLCFSLLRKSASQIRNLASIIKFFICSLILLSTGESTEVRSRFWDVTLIKTWLQVVEGANCFIVIQSQNSSIPLAGVLDTRAARAVLQRNIMMVRVPRPARFVWCPEILPPGAHAVLYLGLWDFFCFQFIFWICFLGRTLNYWF